MPYVGPITPGRKLSFLPAGQTCAQQSRRPTETCLWFTSLLLRLLTFTSPIIPAWASDDTACGQGLQELLQAGSNVSLPYAQRKIHALEIVLFGLAALAVSRWWQVSVAFAAVYIVNKTLLIVWKQQSKAALREGIVSRGEAVEGLARVAP